MNRREVAVLVGISVVISAAILASNASSQPMIAPDFTLTDIKGNEFGLSDFRGKPVLIDFMATWCVPCRSQMTYLKEIWENPGNQIAIISVDVDPRESLEDLTTYVSQYPYAAWIWARDTAGIAWVYKVDRIPALVLIDEKGYMQKSFFGVTSSSDLLEGFRPVFNPSELAFAFFTGMLVLLSPCAFPLLPGYISFYLGASAPLEKALFDGASCALGLLTIFSSFGIASSLLGKAFLQSTPLLELVAAVIMIAMGLILITGYTIPIPKVTMVPPKRRGYLNTFVYGIAYGFAAFGCSAPLLISFFVYAATRAGLQATLLMLVCYSAGIALPLIALTILVSEAKTSLIKKITKVAPLMNRLAGLTLICVGIYLGCYYLALQWTPDFSSMP